MDLNFIVKLSLLFFLSEFILMLVKRSGKSGTKIKGDRLSLLLFWLAIPLGITAGFLTAGRGEWTGMNRAVAGMGLLLFGFGLLIRWLAIFQLKKEFTVNVAISDTHTLNQQGLYGYMRHPSYSGLLLICAGLSVAMNSLLSVVIVMGPVFIATFYRIRVEERMLMAEFGEQYENYRKTTSGLIPKIHR